MTKAIPGAAMLALCIAAAPAAPAASDLAPHRAAYVLKLESTQPGVDVTDIRGAMVFELADECDGWSVHQEFRMEVTTGQGDSFPTQTLYSSYEAKDGSTFRFETTSTTRGDVTEEIKGEARRGEDGGEAVLTKPANERLPLPPGTVFPSRHAEMVIERARDGAKLVDRHMFDGSIAEGAYQVVAAIGRPSPAPEGAVAGPLAETPFWPVSMAFYEPGQTEQAPAFQVSGRLHENGVASNMMIDYGDFSVRATLDSVSALGPPKC